VTDPAVLVATNTADDAGVYRIAPDLALVQTVDIFTPIVDEPYWFGAIAAANAMSDVYAMGGTPKFALNFAGFPRAKLPLDVLGEILRGGGDKCSEAGVVIIGGHTIEDPEPKYGLAVTGFVHPNRIVTNAAARPGDRLVLTKPLGMGVITTGIKQERTSPAAVQEAIRIMATLNRGAAQAMTDVGVSAATDVTGFGLLGHLHEMTRAAKVRARIGRALNRRADLQRIRIDRDHRAAGAIDHHHLRAIGRHGDGMRTGGAETERQRQINAGRPCGEPARS